MPDFGRSTQLRADGSSFSYDPQHDSGILTPPRVHELTHACIHEDWEHNIRGACLLKGCLCTGRWTDTVVMP